MVPYGTMVHDFIKVFISRGSGVRGCTSVHCAVYKNLKKLIRDSTSVGNSADGLSMTANRMANGLVLCDKTNPPPPILRLDHRGRRHDRPCRDLRDPCQLHRSPGELLNIGKYRSCLNAN